MECICILYLPYSDTPNGGLIGAGSYSNRKRKLLESWNSVRRFVKIITDCPSTLIRDRREYYEIRGGNKFLKN